MIFKNNVYEFHPLCRSLKLMIRKKAAFSAGNKNFTT